MSTKIYALLVGIVDYEEQISLDNGTVYFPKLQGCVNDARKIKEYLRANYLEEDCLIKELYDPEATKENICNSFLTHLGPAKKGESVLFYYSGHGTQEFADACLTEETDRRLESLVCYYKSGHGNFLLADKELRYLIHQVAKTEANITLVMDCCHSGDVTINAIFAATEDVTGRSFSAFSRYSPQLMRRIWLLIAASLAC